MSFAIPTAAPQDDAVRPAVRLPVLDGVRGAAILIVMQFHFWGLPFALSQKKATFPLDAWVNKVIGAGWSGVDLFFVLSGFLITGILFDAKGRHPFFGTFYARRALRIVPVYAAFLAFLIVVLPRVGFLDSLAATAQVEQFREIQIWFWLFLTNIAFSLEPLDVAVPFVHAHLWSLAVEEQFYLVWPVVVLALGRRALLCVCVAMVAAAFAIRFGLTAGFASEIFTAGAAGVLMPARMDTLALGALIALALRGDEWRVLNRLAPPTALLSLGALGGLYLRNGELSVLHQDTMRYAYTAFAFLFACVLLYVVQSGPRDLAYRALTSAPLRMFGRYSYAIYIVHLLLAYQLAHEFIVRNWTPQPGGSQIPLNVVFSISATLAATALAWISWRLIEAPLLQFKARFTYGARRPDPGALPEIDDDLEPVPVEAG